MNESEQELDELWLLFEQDGLRSLDEAEQHLLTLESDAGDNSALNGLYRALHSLKGNARVMGLSGLEALTHKTEDLVGLCRDGVCELSEDRFDLVLEAVDVLRTIVPETVSMRGEAASERGAGLVERIGETVAILDVDGSREAASGDDSMVFDEAFGEVDFDFDFDIDGLDSTGDGSSEVALGSEAEAIDASSAAESEAEVSALAVSKSEEALVAPAPVERVEETSPVSEPPPVASSGRIDPPKEESESQLEPSAPVPTPGLETSKELPRSDAKPTEKPSPTSAPQTPPTKPTSQKRADAGRSPNASNKRDAFIQVRSSKIQELLAIASDLGLSVDNLLAHPDVLASSEHSEDLSERAHRLRRLMRDLRFSAAGLALVPVSELFSKVRRVSRELGRETGKTFELVLDGEDTEIDKSLIDALGDPILHIVRNAVDHGLESPAERLAAGKPEKGRIFVSASYSGNEVVIVFADDGRGLDTAAIRRKAEQRGLITANAELDEPALHRLILQPGFSTKDAVSELSGRGVGMDVVNETIQTLRGRFELSSKRGSGTTMALHLPLTLAFADALVIEVGPYLYAIPLESVGRILLPKDNDWFRNSAEGIDYIDVQGRTVPVRWLDGAHETKADENRRNPVVTVRTSGGEVALPVGVLRGTQQVTIRPLDRFSSSHPVASSCGILGNGDVAMTLDCERLIEKHRA